MGSTITSSTVIGKEHDKLADSARQQKAEKAALSQAAVTI